MAKEASGIGAWLAGDEQTIRIPTGYQEIAIASQPNIFVADRSYLTKSDGGLMAELLEGLA